MILGLIHHLKLPLLSISTSGEKENNDDGLINWYALDNPCPIEEA